MGKLPSLFTSQVFVRVAARAGVFLIVVSGVIWAGYFFHVGALPELEPSRCGGGVRLSHILTGILSRYTLPAPEFFQGVIEILQHNDCGHEAYLLGEKSLRGWWYYFPVAVGVKSTIPLLLLFGMAIGVAAASGFAGLARPVLVTVVVFSAVLAVGMASGINIGIRHVLVRLFGADTLWEEGAHPCSCR